MRFSSSCSLGRLGVNAVSSVPGCWVCYLKPVVFGGPPSDMYFETGFVPPSAT